MVATGTSHGPARPVLQHVRQVRPQVSHQPLNAAVNGLRPEERDVVALRYFLDLGEDETAAALGIPRGTVKSRLARALVKLQERVE